MWDFTSGFLAPIGSLVFSQIFDSHIMIRPRVSRTSSKLHELISYMFQIRFPCYYSDYCMNFRTLAMYLFFLNYTCLVRYFSYLRYTCLSYKCIITKLIAAFSVCMFSVELSNLYRNSVIIIL